MDRVLKNEYAFSKKEEEGKTDIVLIDDLTGGEMWTLRESIEGRGIQSEGKGDLHFGYVGSEKPVEQWGESVW